MAGVQTVPNPSIVDKWSIDQRDHRTQEGELFQVNLKGRPVNRSKTRARKSAPYVYGLFISEAEGLVFGLSMVTYLTTVMHQPPAKAATITTNFVGSSYILTLLGGFIADSYLGAYWTIAAGAVISSLGYGLITFSASYSGLQPSKNCTPNVDCSPAAAHYMAPLYVALYTIALGSGLVKPNLLSLGADQFDNSIPKEKEQGTHFFLYTFFFTHVGIFLGVTFGVYLVVNVSAGWGYGFSLMLYGLGEAIFFLGTPRFRHRPPTGSFITRMAQVLVAALRKWRVRPPQGNSGDLYDPPTPPGSMIQKLHHTSSLRALDRAATLVGTEDREVFNRRTSSWRLTPVTQVEETKRILQMVPIWFCLAVVSIVYSQLTTFTIVSGTTLDRKLGSHFTIPAPTLSGVLTLGSMIIVPVYDRLIVPFVRRFNNNPYGFTPLQRLGVAILFATLTNIAGALVERKRLTYVRKLHYEDFILGTYELPMTVWWLVPQFLLGSVVDFNFFVSGYQLFYHEAAVETRSIASSFTYLAFAMGNFFSTVVVNLVNRLTRHRQGGSWLKGQLNNGGLEKFYWLLAVMLAINLLIFMVFALCYRYKYDWYHKSQANDGHSLNVSDNISQSTERSDDEER